MTAPPPAVPSTKTPFEPNAQNAGVQIRASIPESALVRSAPAPLSPAQASMSPAQKTVSAQFAKRPETTSAISPNVPENPDSMTAHAALAADGNSAGGQSSFSTMQSSPMPEEDRSIPSQTSALPDDFYSNLQPPPDMDDLDNAISPEMMQLESDTPTEMEEEHHGMRRPTLDEFDTLKNHPFVQRVNNVFHVAVVDARLKN